MPVDEALVLDVFREIAQIVGLPDATVLVLQGTLFVVILFCETFYGRFKIFNPDLWKRSL